MLSLCNWAIAIGNKIISPRISYSWKVLLKNVYNTKSKQPKRTQLRPQPCQPPISRPMRCALTLACTTSPSQNLLCSIGKLWCGSRWLVLPVIATHAGRILSVSVVSSSSIYWFQRLFRMVNPIHDDVRVWMRCWRSRARQKIRTIHRRFKIFYLFLKHSQTHKEMGGSVSIPMVQEARHRHKITFHNYIDFLKTCCLLL